MNTHTNKICVMINIITKPVINFETIYYFYAKLRLHYLFVIWNKQF